MALRWTWKRDVWFYFALGHIAGDVMWALMEVSR